MKKSLIFISIVLIISILIIGIYIYCNNIPYSEIDLDTIALEVTSVNNEGNYITNYSNAKDLKTLLNNFEYIDGVCKCEADYVLKFSDNTIYYIDLNCNAIQTNGKQVNISEEKMQEILNYINNKGNNINTMTLSVTSINSEETYSNNYSNVEEFKILLDNFEYIDGVCNSEADYVLKFSDDTVYHIDLTCNAIRKDGKQASISEEKIQEILNYIENNNNENNSNQTKEIIPNVK